MEEVHINERLDTPEEDIPRQSKSTRSIAFLDEKGEVEVVHADEFRVCVPTKDCVQFWFTLLACCVVMIPSLIIIVVRGAEDRLLPLWVSLFSAAFGVLVPSPNYSTAFKVPKN